MQGTELTAIGSLHRRTDMADIFWGLAVIACCALATFCATLWASRQSSHFARDVMALAVVALIFVYFRFLWYNPRLAGFLPFSNVVIVGNWFPLAAAVLGGLAWGRIPGHAYRRTLFVGGLALTSAYSLVCPLLGDRPVCVTV